MCTINDVDCTESTSGRERRVGPLSGGGGAPARGHVFCLLRSGGVARGGRLAFPDSRGWRLTGDIGRLLWVASPGGEGWGPLRGAGLRAVGGWRCC